MIKNLLRGIENRHSFLLQHQSAIFFTVYKYQVFDATSTARGIVVGSVTRFTNSHSNTVNSAHIYFAGDGDV